MRSCRTIVQMIAIARLNTPEAPCGKGIALLDSMKTAIKGEGFLLLCAKGDVTDSTFGP